MAQQVGSASLQESETNRVIGITRSCIDNKIILVPTFINEEFENKILRAELFNIEDLTGNKMNMKIGNFTLTATNWHG